MFRHGALTDSIGVLCWDLHMTLFWDDVIFCWPHRFCLNPGRAATQSGHMEYHRSFETPLETIVKGRWTLFFGSIQWWVLHITSRVLRVNGGSSCVFPPNTVFPHWGVLTVGPCWGRCSIAVAFGIFLLRFPANCPCWKLSMCISTVQARRKRSSRD